MNTRERLLALLALCLCLAGSMTVTACEETEEEQVGENTEDVVNPTKIVGYEGTKQFTSDLEALVDYGCAVYAMRLAFWNVASNDFRTGELFCASLKDIDKNTTSIYDFYDLASTIVENADKYEEAFQRLEDEGVLENVNASRQTRGWLSDTFSFVFGLRFSHNLNVFRV